MAHSRSLLLEEHKSGSQLGQKKNLLLAACALVWKKRVCLAEETFLLSPEVKSGKVLR